MDLINKEILITGGTGSLGKMLVKLLIKDKHVPKGIRIFSRDELKQWQMSGEIKEYQKEHGTQIPISYIIGDVREYESLFRAFTNVDIVINAAAMKQVPACEDNPLEAVMTNVNGVQNIIKAALACKVSKVMQVSTDKAVEPVNLYGATKAVAEKLMIHANVYTRNEKTIFSCCRYGNVLGSRGSIVPLFKQQIKENKDITITHKDMSRFWISLTAAAGFILQKIKYMQKGEIYIPIMKACYITDIVNYLSRGYPIQYTGIRHGEKLHECLISIYEYALLTPSGFTVKKHIDPWNDSPQYKEGLYSNVIANKEKLNEEEFKKMLVEEIQ